MKMKFFVGMTLQAVALVSFSAFAQVQSQNVENEAMIEIVNDPLPAAKMQSTTVQTQSSVQQPFVLQNQPQITQQQPTIYVQKQNTTVVEDSPLTESNADKLRKQRVEMEQQTESKIVEKLEESRMRAEKQRAEKIMGNLEGMNQEKEEEKVEAPVVAAPVIVTPQVVDVAPAPEPVVVQQAEEINNAPAIEVKSELAELKEEEKTNTKMYISADAGFMSYSADNIRTTGAVGATIGTLIDERYIAEGSFLFSKGDVESVTRPAAIGWNGQYYPTIIEMKQYNFSGAFKYRILKTRLSPYIGGLLSYTHRAYEDRQFFDSYYALEGSSWAIDAGAIVGADIRLTDSFTIGADFRYVMNLAYDTDTKGRLETSRIYEDFYTDPVEEMGYYSLLVNARFSF